MRQLSKTAERRLIDWGILALLIVSSSLTMWASASHAVDPTIRQGGPAIKQLPLQSGASSSMKDAAFKTLPDSAVIQFQGKAISKGALKALQAQARREAETQLKAAVTQANAKFQSRRTQFLQQQQAEIQTTLVKARAETTHLRQALVSATPAQQDPIRSEAITLLQRSKSATPAERAQIEQRALQLEQQSLPRLTPKVARSSRR
jgi:hypothetical protein